MFNGCRCGMDLAFWKWLPERSRKTVVSTATPALTPGPPFPSNFTHPKNPVALKDVNNMQVTGKSFDVSQF